MGDLPQWPQTGGQELLVHKDAADGYAGLDGNTLLKVAELPAVVQQTGAKDTPNGYAGLDGNTLLKLAEFPASIPIPGDSAAGGGGSAGQKLVVRSDGTLGYITDTVEARAWGAKGDGVTDDTTAITNAAATGKCVHFSAGNYIFNPNGNAPLSGLANPAFIADDKASTSITVGNNGYFIDQAGAFISLLLRNITFTGATPAGFVRSTFNGINVQNPKVIDNCVFQNHQVCAVSSNATDEPYWKFLNLRFWTTNVTTAIDIALAGNADSCEFLSTAFTGARVNIKLRASCTAKLTDCDFIPYYAQSGGVQRARVWLVPSQTAVQGGCAGTQIRGCKLGNEQQATTDFHILIAGELAGNYVGDMQPDLATAQVNPIIDLQIDSWFAGANATAPSPIYTLNESLPGLELHARLFGTRPTELLQYATAPTTADSTMSTMTLRYTMQDTSVAAIRPNFTNAGAMIGMPDDPAGLGVTDPVSPFAGPGDVADLTNISPPSASGWNTSSSTVTADTDRIGGTDAATITATAANGYAYGTCSTNPTVGRPAWVELDIKAGAANPAAAVWLYVTTGGFAQIFLQAIITPTANWVRYRFPVSFVDSAATLIAIRIPVNGDEVQVGRVKVYHARAPIAVEPAFPIAVTTAAAPAAGGAGALPATPKGYARVMINGSPQQIAYY